MLFLVPIMFLASIVFAKPYPNPNEVISPLIEVNKVMFRSSDTLSTEIKARDGLPVLRAEIAWQAGEKYSLKGIFYELSGTEGLVKSSLNKDLYGSFKAKLVIQTEKGEIIYHSSLGTGREFRRLLRTLSFRFPYIADAKNYRLILEAEHPENGKMEKVLDQELDLEKLQTVSAQDVKVTSLRKALIQPSIKFNFYAEGYATNGEKSFLKAARKAIEVLEKYLPGSEAFEFRAVFAPSHLKLGKAQDLGPTLEVRDSFLGLYFPYWRKFGRWYHVVYPTEATKYRNALAQAAYDYPLVLVDDAQYWGVGNYMELTAIPAKSRQFSYLLLHEFGHFMGLNEEYEGGGPTELEFAPGMKEPWSQNITFNTDPLTIKWSSHIEPGIKIPTTLEEWTRFGGSLKNPVGAYRGGYADSQPQGRSHKPVMKCMMSSGGDFCPVCTDALKEMINIDAGN